MGPGAFGKPPPFTLRWTAPCRAGDGHDKGVISVRELYKVGTDLHETTLFTAFRGHVGPPAATTKG